MLSYNTVAIPCGQYSTIFRLNICRSTKSHVITTQTEHKCVLDSCRALESEGFSVTYLPVSTGGLVDVAALEAAITPATVLVSVMGVNNEIGVVQPLAEIGAVCRRRKVFFHTDAAQVRRATAEQMNGDSRARSVAINPPWRRLLPNSWNTDGRQGSC